MPRPSCGPPPLDGHPRGRPRATSWSSGSRPPIAGPSAAVLDGWFRERARVLIDVEIARHAAALGVSPTAVSVRDQRSRWGSASRHGRLSFSWRLVLAPPEALETVVIHELAHLRVFGHGPAFWALVAARRPDHLAWRKWLRTHSLELHAALDDTGNGADAATEPRPESGLRSPRVPRGPRRQSRPGVRPSTSTICEATDAYSVSRSRARFRIQS